MKLYYLLIILGISSSIGCRGTSDKQADSTADTKIIPLSKKELVIEKLRLLESKSEFKGREVRDCFPDSIFKSYVIRMAISGLLLDEWRINGEMSLFLFAKPQFSSPYEERPTGVLLEIEDTAFNKVAHGYNSQARKYFGATSELIGEGLDLERDYYGFILVNRREDFEEDMQKNSLYTSKNLK